MYTAQFKYMDGKQQKLKTKKFLFRVFAMMWVNHMQKKFPVFVVQIQGSHFYYCVM